MLDTIVFTIRAEDAYGRIRIETNHSSYSKYNTTALSRRHVFETMNNIADQMNNEEGMAVVFEVEG